MPIVFDNEEEDKQEKIQNIVSNSLWGSPDNPNHPEYEGDCNEMTRERLALMDANVSPWDRLLTPRERRKIAKCNPELYENCPHLQLAEGSEGFYFCQALADEYVKRGRAGSTIWVKFSGKVASSDSAESYARFEPRELKAHCVGENFKHCDIFQANDPNTKFPFSK